MDKNDLVKVITERVMQQVGAGSSSQQGSSSQLGGSCSTEKWNGVGTVADMLKAGASRVSTGASLGSCPDPKLASLIDHTLLKPEATEDEINTLCAEAADSCFMSVCVNPSWVATARKNLRNTSVKVCTVIGFPLGATPTRVKELEARIAIADGAEEVDMVINIGYLKSKKYKEVENDIRGVVRAARGDIITKVIFETALLTKEEIVIAAELSAKAGADFVKTSTGFAKGGATAENIRLMRETVGKDMGVKASGAIRDHETAMTMINAGASRIGASASVAIVGCKNPGGGSY